MGGTGSPLAARARGLARDLAPGLSSRRLPLWGFGILIALATASWWYAHAVLPWGPWGGDAREFSVIARRLASGEGFTTPVIFPVELREFGATANHPSLMRAPLWPLVLAGFFAVFGPEGWAVDAATLVCFLGVVICSSALATRLGGAGAGLVAGIAVATSPQPLLFAIDGMSETCFALWVVLVFLLCARGAAPFWIGVVCGLGYLTRYNGGVLVVVACGLLAFGPGRLRAAAWCAAGFLAAALPWWVRNALVTGDPFYSLYNLHVYMSPLVAGNNLHLHYMLEPDLEGPNAIDPIEKLRIIVPEVLRHFPYAGANLAACVGTLLAVVRRDALAIAFWSLALANLLVVSLALGNGRYFVPLFPAMIALGVAAWVCYGARTALPGLALVLAAPLLPTFPPPLADVGRLTAIAAGVRAGLGYGTPKFPTDPDARTRCLEGRPVVLAEDASLIAWQTDAIAIHLPANGLDFWRIVSEQPVRFVQKRKWDRMGDELFDRHFTQRADCGPDVYELTTAPPVVAPGHRRRDAGSDPDAPARARR
jgi:hypothetical protein